MSGWIRIEKDLGDSIRFRRLVKALRASSNALRAVTNGSDRFFVTWTLGALVRFWMYADTHIDNNNTLAIALDEIDEIVGIDGFAKALPADWLQVIDSDRVQLPNFLEHNGSSEKARRDNARRQAEYRHRHRNGNVTHHVTDSNNSNDARPDQTRLDQTRPDQKEVEVGARKRASRLPENWIPDGDGESYARGLGLDPDRVLIRFRDHWRAAPGQRGVKADWKATWRTWCRTAAERAQDTAPTNGLDAPKKKPEWIAELEREEGKGNVAL